MKGKPFRYINNLHLATGYEDQVVSVLSDFTWGNAIQKFMILLRRIKHNLKTGIIQARKDTDILTNLESEHNDKLFAADSNPEEALLYDELLQAGDALKRKMH